MNNENNNTNEIPCASDEKIVIKTVKEKKKTNFTPALIIIIVLGLGIYYMDDIIKLFEPKTLPIIKENNTNDSLVDGFIVIDDNTAYMTRDDIRFYNFKKSDNENIITLNYIPYKNYDTTNELLIYIELFNQEKEMIYKDKYIDTNLNIDQVKTYTMNIPNNILNDSVYAIIKKHTLKEINEKTTLTCRFKEVGQGYDLTYKNIYNFINEELIDYEVNKELNISEENTVSTKYKNDIENEIQNINSKNIKISYENNKLNYKIDLNKLDDNFTTYTLKDTKSIVKNSMLEGWVCE